MPKLDNQTVLLAVVAVTALAMLLQTLFLLAIFLTVRKASISIRSEIEKLRSALMPVIFDTRDILSSTRETQASMQEFLTATQGFFVRVMPKIESAAGELAEIAHGLRVQGAQLQASAQELAEKVRKQGDRLDGMVTNVLDSVDRAGGFVADAVGKPVRQVSGILRSAKAIIESLRGHRAAQP